MSDELNALAAKLHELWDREYDEVSISYDPAYYGNPAFWHIILVARTEWGNPHSADWAEYRWTFYDADLLVVFRDAVEFASALRELADADE